MSSLFHGASKLGFGCASLGSRISARKGARALSEGFEAGINWFDVAPSYGDGAAEEILGGFVQRRRDRCFICTKVGVEPPGIGRRAAAFRPFARALVQLAPVTRKIIASRRQAPTRAPLSRALIMRSVERSLVRLGTDYVDVLALHDPSVEDFAQEEVVRALEDIHHAGKARTIGVAGSVDAIAAAAAGGLNFGIAQFSAGQIDKARTVLGDLTRPVRLITHSVSSLERGRTMSEKLAVALTENREGTVLISMYTKKNLEENLETLSETREPRLNS